MEDEAKIGKYPNVTTEAAPQVNELRRIFRVMFSRWVVVLSMIIILALIVTAVFAPWIAPYDPIKTNMLQSLKQPSSEHLLGTDKLGRDVLSRIIYGTRVSLWVGVVAVSIACIIGMLLGLVAGYFSGWINTIIMRLTDTFMALPPIVLSIAIAGLLGGGLKNVTISIGISMIPTYCRLMCAQVLSIKENDFIVASFSIGASSLRIMFFHLLPNAFPTILVLITLNMGITILAEASLSFLGIGISPPDPAWGAMVSDGYRYMLINPTLSIAPGVAVMLLVLSFNIVGDGLRDALDPKLRGTL